MTPICVVDTETTGLHPNRLAWDIAMIRLGDDGKTEWQFYVDVDLSEAEPMGLKVGRFYERHPYGRYLAGSLPHPYQRLPHVHLNRVGSLLSPAEAAQHVARVTHGAHIVGAVPSFDTEVLSALLLRHGLTPGWHYHLIDIEALAVGYLQGVAQAVIDHAGMNGETPPALDRTRAMPPWKSEDISRACGVEPAADEDRHTALGDARWALRLYEAITGGSRG